MDASSISIASLRVKVASGIWPLPAKTPLNAVVHGARDMGDYTIEKVYFESLPGHFVTGSLYRPAGKSLERALEKILQHRSLRPTRREEADALVRKRSA